MSTETRALPQNAAHAGRIKLTRTDDVAPRLELSGDAAGNAVTYWNDGTTSYVLNFRSGFVHGGTIADEADTVIQAVDSLRAGEEMSNSQMWSALQDVRKLRTRLSVLESELILYGREKGDDGRPRMPLRELAEGIGIHHTTVAERVARMESGEHHPWRNWLVQGTDRERMYGGPGAAFRVDVTSWDRGQGAAVDLCRNPHADGSTACGRPHGHHAVPNDLGHQDHDGRRWPNG